jgi:hypothetical protein
MKKLLLVLGVLMGLVVLSGPSYALRAVDSTSKTVYAQPLVSSPLNGNASFITGSTNTVATGQQNCASQGAGATNGTQGTLMACGSTPILSFSLSGGASGGTVTIYDASTNQINNSFPAEAMPQEVVFEATVAANTALYVDLSNAPINTNNGVVAAATSTSGVVIYTSPAIAANH